MNDDLRGRIFSKALNGRWSSATAEKVAKRLGLESFENKPDVCLFDPMTRPAWTLAMAGAWLSWRTREKVCESWDEYCKDWLAWRAFERSDERYAIGYELVNVPPASLLLQGFPGLDERPPFMSGGQAKEALWNALGSGQIKASAIPNDGSRPVEIPSREWSYIVLTGTAQVADRLSFQGEMTVVAYREVTVRRDDILSIWPASDGLHKTPAADESIDVTVKGRTTKAIETAIRELFPDGAKVNATRRNEMIIEHVKNAIGTKPNPRTVQRVLANMAEGRLG